MGHFVTKLRFPLDPDMLEILKFYEVPLCHYTPIFIGRRISFFSLLHSKELPFAVDIFCALFYTREMQDGTLSIGAHANRKLILGVPRRFHYWQKKFLFGRFLSTFPFPSHWKDLWKGHSEHPKLFDEEVDCLRF